MRDKTKTLMGRKSLNAWIEYYDPAINAATRQLKREGISGANQASLYKYEVMGKYCMSLELDNVHKVEWCI